MRALLALPLLALAACAPTQPDAASEPARLPDVLAGLEVTPLAPGVRPGVDGWDALPWTVRHAVEAAEARLHVAVAGEEVDLFEYGSRAEAEGEARRIAEAFGALPLAATEADPAGPPAAYFVAGRALVRHRGDDSTVAARLTAAYGDPAYVAGTVRASFAGGPAPDAALAPSGACYPDNLRVCLGWRSYSEYAERSLLYHTYTPPFRQSTLYQGEHVPAWTVIPRLSAYDNTPPPSQN